MGEMLLNGRLYGASGIRELTQAQYDALPSSKLTDGVLYCIKDTGIVEGEKFAPVIYSLEEREIGVWTDGKPIYQQTVHISSLPSTTYSTQTYPHNIADIDQIVDYNAIIRWSATNKQVANTTRIGLFSSTNYQQNFIGCIAIEATKDNILVVVGTDRSSMSADVTIQYTKTTDIPGSGHWGTDGVPMVHYDGNEKIIGTWFGETLYEKTFLVNAPSSANTATSVADVSACSIDKVISLFGHYYGSVGNSDVNITIGTDVSACWVNTAKTNLMMQITNSQRFGANCQVTIQYTKTSS